MAGPPRGEDPKNENGKENDNLKRIEGIGEAKAQWLKSIGITSIYDLANASADYLESRLKAEGHATDRNEIEEKWIPQAQELVDASSSQQTTDPLKVEAKASLNAPSKESEPCPPLEATSEPDPEPDTSLRSPSKESEPRQPHEATSEPEEVKVLVSSSTKRDEWSTFAAFAIEFQDRKIENRTEERTIVRHVETDTVQSWSSIEGENFKRWILGQVAQAKPFEQVVNQSVTATPVIIKMGQLNLLQPAEKRMPVLVAQTGQILSNSIRSDEPFALEVSFELIGDALSDIAENRVTYCVQWDAKNLAPPHEIVSLGDTQPKFVVADQTSYTTRLPEVTLHSGIYRLQILVILRGIVALPAFLDALVLQVI